MLSSPSYLRDMLPQRSSKPRTTGITAIIDFGPGTGGWTGEAGLADLLGAAEDFIDLAKIYALNSILLPQAHLRKSVSHYHAAGIEVYSGGILFEFAFRNGAVDQLPRLLADLGIRNAEVSENYLELSPDERRRQIDMLTEAGLGIVYEFGRKHPEEPFEPRDLESIVLEMRELGVLHVILEQSEIDLLEEREPGALHHIARAPWFAHVLIECDPNRFPGQHADLTGMLGADVNVANIAPGQVLGLECARRGIGRPVDYALIHDEAVRNAK